MPGAAILAARAAQRAGAGLVTVVHFWPGTLGVVAGACPEALHLDLSQAVDLQSGRMPQALQQLRRDARLVGPGLTRGGRTRELVRCLLEDSIDATPLLLDADALGVLAGNAAAIAEASAPVILTPHGGEARGLLGRDLGSSAEERLAAARALAQITRATVVLKGQGTVVVQGDKVFICERGNPGMATAGSGDVLSGIIAALLCRCSPGEGGAGSYGIFDAVCAAVELHGRAGDLQEAKRGSMGLIASDLIDGLPAACLAMEAEGR